MFQEQKFDIPELKGISKKTIEEHLKLYSGYVKHANLILEKIKEYGTDAEKNAYAINEMQRRFGFEFDGMRNHEYYFKALEDGAKNLEDGSALKAAVEKEWGSWDTWMTRFKAIAMTRGIGWAVLYYDPETGHLVNAWIDEQHLGHLTGIKWIFGIDMWEHSFLFDYVPGDKKKYLEAYLENVNWSAIEKNFENASK